MLFMTFFIPKLLWFQRSILYIYTMKETQRQANSTKVAGLPTEKKAQTLSIVQGAIAENLADTDYKVLGSKTKKGLSLDETMSLIEQLHQKKRFRDRLDVYIDLLNSFEIEQKKEDLDKDGYYVGCSMVITDDKRGSFTLKNPTLIGEVINFLTDRMKVKLSEIESEIVLPN